MNTLIYLFVVVCTVTVSYENESPYPIEVRGVIENTINTTLNNLKEKIPELIAVPSQSYDFDKEGHLSGALNITKLTVQGLRDFTATEIKANIFNQKLDAKIVIPELSIQLKYWVDLVLLDLAPFYGQGRMSINFDEVELAINGKISLVEKSKVKDITLSVTLGEATFHLDGMLNNPEYSAIVSSILSDNFAEFLDDNAELVSKAVSPIAQAILDHYLDSSRAVTLKYVKISS